MTMQSILAGFKIRHPLYHLAAIIFLSVISVTIIYGLGLNGPPIRSDGFGYYTYLPSFFIYNDISMEWLANTDLKSLGDYPNSLGWTGISRFGDTGKYLDKYGIGVAILQAPFFLVSNVLAKWFGSNTNGYGAFYQVGSIISGIFYFSLGLIFLFNFLIKYFQTDVVISALAFHIFGTGVFLYATYDGSAVPSHIYAFCVVTGLLWSLGALKKKRIMGSMFCGFCLGLLFMIRNVDILFGILFILFGVKSLKDFKFNLCNKSWWAGIAVAGVLFFLTIMPQLYYWKMITGHWLIYSYQGEAFNWSDPQLFNVLFSARKGLFVYYPILMLSLIGFYWIKRHVEDLFVPIVVFLGVHLYFVASWGCWWYGGSFGMRPFVEAVPIFLIGFCSLVSEIKSQRVLVLVQSVSILCCSWTIYYMFLYWTNVVPFDGMTFQKHFWIWLQFDWAFFLIAGLCLVFYFKVWNPGKFFCEDKSLDVI